MAEIYIDKNGLKRYVKSHRLVYKPDLFKNHRKSWTTKELTDLVGFRLTMKWEDIALMLGRTPGVCACKYSRLKKTGKIEKFLKLFN